MAGSKKSWWQSWIGIIVGLGTLCTLILGAITFLYATFPTNTDLVMADQKRDLETKIIVSELSEETIKGFKEVHTTNQQMQKAIQQNTQDIKRNYLTNEYTRLVNDEKYLIKKFLSEHPDDIDAQKHLEKVNRRIKEVERKLQLLK